MKKFCSNCEIKENNNEDIELYKCEFLNCKNYICDGCAIEFKDCPECCSDDYPDYYYEFEFCIKCFQKQLCQKCNKNKKKK
jgi:hypothetical protein